MKNGNIIIESIGDYLLFIVVFFKEVLEGCVNEFRFFLECIIGIKEWRMVGVEEFVFDLVRKVI